MRALEFITSHVVYNPAYNLNSTEERDLETGLPRNCNWMGNYQIWKLRISDKRKQERAKNCHQRLQSEENRMIWALYSMVIWVVKFQREANKIKYMFGKNHSKDITENIGDINGAELSIIW